MDSVFENKISELCRTDLRYSSEAYRFVTDAVTFTVQRLEAHRHVTARELLEGMRDYAVNEYGAMAEAVLVSWGVSTASDVGNLVYNLIGVELLSASPGDKRSDFDIDYPPYPCGTEQAVQQPAFSLPKID